MAVLTFFYVIATIFIYCANKKSADAMISANIHSNDLYDQNRIIQQQNVKIQLFNDRFDLYRNIRNYLEKKYGCILSFYEIIDGRSLNNYIDTHADEMSILKTKYLYDNSCYLQVEKIKSVINEIASLSSDIQRYCGALRFHNNEFINKITEFIVLESKEELDISQIEEFKELCDKNEIPIDNIPNEVIYYNFYDMDEKLTDLHKQYNEESSALYKQFENLLLI